LEPIKTHTQFRPLTVYPKGRTAIPAKHQPLFDDPTKEIPYAVAAEVFDSQHYKDPPMRGRQSVNPINKLGFSIAKGKGGKIKITELGNLYLSEDSDLGEIFFKSLLKLHFPNPTSSDFNLKNGFDIQPIIAVMHLIKKTGSLTKNEFSLFVTTLINYRDIETNANAIIEYRKLNSTQKKAFAEKYLKGFYGVPVLTEKQESNLYEYGDNSMRYLRLTKYFSVVKHTFADWTINLEPARRNEIEQLLVMFNGAARSFQDYDDYVTYVNDVEQPALLWEIDRDKSREAAVSLRELITGEFAAILPTLPLEGISRYKALTTADIAALELREVRGLIGELRALRIYLIEARNANGLRHNLSELKSIISVFKEKTKFRELEAAEFEHVIAKCFKILDDEIAIKSNCILDDEGKPIGFAPGNRADIEVYYTGFNGTIEVTLDVSRNQVYRESMPVMRHLRDFEEKNSEKPAFCVFIAPRVHSDTINYLWVSIKHGFEGKKQRIVAFNLESFTKFLECALSALEEGKTFTHQTVLRLFDSVVAEGEVATSSLLWYGGVSDIISKWEHSVV
jgi:hypothetical protein